jgi:pimeloyl-ACP methyl ester carboxylesterase
LYHKPILLQLKHIQNRSILSRQLQIVSIVMPFFKRNNKISIFYLDEGPKTAPAALLIHGIMCDIHDWTWQVPFLLDLGYRVITPDLRGQGKSSATPPTPNITKYPGPDADPAIVDYYPQTSTADMAALLEHLGVNSVIIMAHSLGDLVGYNLAVSRPDLVRATIGMDPTHAFDNAAREANKAFFEDPTKVVDNLAQFFTYFCYSPTTPAWLKTWHLRRAAESDPEVLYAICWGAWGDEESFGRKENAIKYWGWKLKVPRLTFGSADDKVTVDRDHLPKGSELDQVILIENHGHWFHQEDSETFNSRLKGWLEKIGELPLKSAA